jgi:hypothetical protein
MLTPINTKLRPGQIIESYETRLEVTEVSCTEARVKVLDCWDRHMRGESYSLCGGCYSTYLEVGKTYNLQRHTSFPDQDVWMFQESELKRQRGFQILLQVFDGKASLDMDT